MSETANRPAVGTRVIAVPNEWRDMAVGTIMDYDEHGIPSFLDVVSGEVLYRLSTTIPFSEEMLTALLKLNPFERFSLITARGLANASQYALSKPRLSEKLMEAGEFLKKAQVATD